MRGLLDTNVLIALFDPDHTFHSRAHEWFAANKDLGWASCPLTENGFVRILANPNYSATLRRTPADLILRLSKFSKRTDHQFWPDEITIRDAEVFLSERIHGPRQLTDIYLLALAMKYKGRLVTFDQNIPISAVRGAKPDNLFVL